MDLIDFVKLIHSGEISSWMQKHRLNSHQCPPEQLLKGRECVCFYCVDCTKYAMSKIKENKDHYKIGKVIYKKEELDDSK